MAGKLYLCATPIGNLKDITLRVLETLAAVDYIVAEDTRRTKKLLTHFDIKKRTISFHDANELKALPKIIADLRAGKTIAQVSDAGLPGIADPGHRLVKACIAAGIPYEVLPGPSALLTAAVLSGLPTDDIRFLGYFPRKAGARRRLLAELVEARSTLVFYEAPHRLIATLADIDAVFGDRQIFIGRELTKQFEEHLRGSAVELLAELKEREIKGELVIIVNGQREPTIPLSPEELTEEIGFEIAAGKSRSDAIKNVANRHNLSKRFVYDLAHHPHT
ncbi:MAG: 16S rRNA (cytidine(1402)-2'-O)-methyltransferase [Actinomycetota bacterium]|nr:16S rRNA (cytidine(1402)-2'-O)-methyltransferase [Actinomycetota bacterium]